MYWEQLSHEEIKDRVFGALKQNRDYRNDVILGLPASYLDNEQFYTDAPFLAEAPFLSTMVANPNHIGCHTMGHQHEEVFAGTQQIEADLIKIITEQIFQAEENSCDGYVASGGTEANIEAQWIYRNYFMKEHGAKHDEIAVVYSVDAHYSLPKGANLLAIKSIIAEVDDNTRQIKLDDLDAKVKAAQADGVKYFIVVANMSTTMFGSVDDIKPLAAYFKDNNLPFKMHLDGAYGGFIYPFTSNDADYSFKNPDVSSITIDGHKMLQSPYGTGIFVCRKGLMQYVETKEAQYVQGLDYTLIGSRSGANAISVWMILMNHGSEGWKYKMKTLQDRTQRLCKRLEAMGVEYYNNKNINIVTMRAKYITPEIAHKYVLVPDTHEGQPNWYKIVMMPHVRQGVIDRFVEELK